jgi:septum formation inhibitor MinC
MVYVSLCLSCVRAIKNKQALANMAHAVTFSFTVQFPTRTTPNHHILQHTTERLSTHKSNSARITKIRILESTVRSGVYVIKVYYTDPRLTVTCHVSGTELRPDE